MGKKKVTQEEKPIAIITDAEGETVAEIKPRYKMIPVDFETYQGVLQICAYRGLNRRSQGMIVSSLIKAELARLPKSE